MMNNIEQYYPITICLVVTCLAILSNFDLNEYSSLIPNTLTITAIFIGFIGTIAGIILSSNSTAITFMKKVGKLSILMTFIWRSLHVSFFFVFYCLILEVYPLFKTMTPLVSWGWVFLGSYSLLLIHRAITRSIALLNAVADDS